MRERSVSILAALVLAGCMVGPTYQKPPATVADAWLASGDKELPTTPDVDYAQWWKTFDDPTLDALIESAYRENPSLEVAGLRVLEALARRGVAIGQLYPQQQEAGLDYRRTSLSENGAQFTPLFDPAFDAWTLTPLAAGWELDLWGRYRRGVESADADLMGSLFAYQDAIVSLAAEVATAYIQIRTLQEQLLVARTNAGLQARSVEIVRTRFELGAVTELDLAQARSLLRATEALIPGVEANIRQAQDRLCVLLGLAPRDLDAILEGPDKIPSAPVDVVVGLPAELLRGRPDIRRAEREMAAQSARIGIAASDFYPRLQLVGNLSLEAEDFADLFKGSSFAAFGGPSFRWAILNYGRIVNNVRVQDARFQQQVGLYETTVLRAQQEVQDAIAGTLGAQRQVGFFERAAADSARAVELAELQYREGAADYTRVLLTQQFLLQAESRLVATRGSVALNLVSLHRSLGGGWQFHEGDAFVRPETRDEMAERIHWGSLLDTEEDYDDLEAADESEQDAWRWWWPQW